MRNRQYAVLCSQPDMREAFCRAAGLPPPASETVTNAGEAALTLSRRGNASLLFFPYWHWPVPKELTDTGRCIGFHPTDLPFGRGGSPIQNLILRGYGSTKLCMYQMNDAMDAGPVFRRVELSLSGTAHEIYVRLAFTAGLLARWLLEAFEQDGVLPVPRPQRPGANEEVFKRRGPEDSRLDPAVVKDRWAFYDFVRMLEAPWLPPAYIETNGGKLVLSGAEMVQDKKVVVKAVWSP